MASWKSVLEMASDRSLTAGSEEALCDAIRCGADLRIYTEFKHNEHIDPTSDSAELWQEVSDFCVTYLVEDHWSAGIMNLRMPLADDFGPRASMSFFMYDQNAQQAVARPYLDGEPISGSREALVEAFADGCEVKVGIRSLCDDLAGDTPVPNHEVFVS